MSDIKAADAPQKKDGIGSMVKLGLIMAIYSAIACVGLALVYNSTAKIIAQRQQADLDDSLKGLFPDADSFKTVADISSSDPAVSIEGDAENPLNTGAFAAIKNGATIGIAIRTSRAGYGGPIKILVGINADSTISGIKILEHKETPGLGANAGSSAYYIDRTKGIHFYDQFAGKKASDPFVPKQDVIVITAATITSQAVSESIRAAGKAAADWFATGAGSPGSKGGF